MLLRLGTPHRSSFTQREGISPELVQASAPITSQNQHQPLAVTTFASHRIVTLPSQHTDHSYKPSPQSPSQVWEGDTSTPAQVPKAAVQQPTTHQCYISEHLGPGIPRLPPILSCTRSKSSCPPPPTTEMPAGPFNV